MTVRREFFRDGWRYAAARAAEGAAPLLRAVARVMAADAPSPPAAWRRGVILGNGHIGDVLYRTCSLHQLASGLPGCRWSYVTTPFAAPLLEGNPAIDAVLPMLRSGAATDLSEESRATLRAMSFDVALCTDSTHHHPELWLVTRLGIPNRVMFADKGFSGLATIPVRLGRLASRPAQFRYMVETLTGRAADSPLRPRVFPSDADVRAADAEWHRSGSAGSDRVVACAVTTRQRTGAFPITLFRDILNALAARVPSLRALLVGGPDDRATLEALAAALRCSTSVSAGQLGIRAMVPLLGRCAAFVGSDSGPRHLANAAGIPVFFVRNMGGSQQESGAYCDSELDIAPPGEYMSPAECERALARLDAGAIADRIAAEMTRQARDTRRDTLPGTAPG